MPTYIVDPTRFQAEGAILNWATVARRLGIFASSNKNFGSTVELRWMLNDIMGVPSEPFGVWSRPHATAPPWAPLLISQRQLEFLGLLTMVTWTVGAMSRVSVDITASGNGVVLAFTGAPTIENTCAFLEVSAGTTTIELAAHVIDGLLVSSSVNVSAVRGIGPASLANAPGWKLIELVGLPVRLPQWAGAGKQGEPQGLVGSFTDAPTAAVNRLTRGAPLVGWATNLSAGYPAPPWSAPDFLDLVVEVNKTLLDELLSIVTGFPPNRQAAELLTVPLQRPRNSSGALMSGPASTTQVAPLDMTLMAAATDPFLSLVLGFGTAYGSAQSDTAIVGRILQDFMITAHWENGLDGKSAALDYAAIIPAPGAPPAPPVPANMFTEFLGALRPTVTNGDWRDSVRLSWDRPPNMQLFRTASFAAARAGINPVEPSQALMNPRPSGGYRPIAINQAADPPDPEFFRLHVVDRELDIPSNPGARQVKYGAAIQDIYGQWTPWVTVDQFLAQPDLETVPIVSLKLSPTAPASGSVCPTTLELEFLWDWRVRSARQISFVGNLYPSVTHGDPPPSMSIPSGFDRTLSGGGPPVVVTFSGDVPSCPGATLLPLAANGDSVSGYGGPQGSDTRRYRLTFTGLSLDFGSTGYIGLAVWAQGQEAIAPQRLTPWPSRPMVTSTGDPRPPIVAPDHVALGSVPDATGSSHVRISWPAQPNATGYFLYEATETHILDNNNLPDPAPSATLDQRLQVVKNAFRLNPDRRMFTRVNSTALTSTSLDIALPRGSTAIHLYIVLGVSAGQVESNWPGPPAPDASLIAIAAPHISVPAPPMIEVQRVLDTSTTPPTYGASLLITSRPGPRPQKIELHRVRVDDAAKELDTMGPPVARVASSGGGWTVTQTPDPVFGPYISTVQGIDSPTGSWKRVWYRATAWSAQDDTRGALPGRSIASNAAWVVLPPSDPPSLSSLLVGGPTPTDVLLEWTCASPLARTPLGPHLIAVRATVVGAPQGTPPLLSLDSTLDALGNSEPATGSGVWIVGTASGVTTYRTILRRSAVTDVLSFAVRITDPLGRTGAQLLSIPGGPVDPPADLENLILKKIPLPPPAHIVLKFTSSSPLVAPLDGPYVLRVIGIKLLPFPLPPPPSFTIPLGNVPKTPPSGVPPAIYAVRSGVGPVFTYTVVSSAALRGFVVRITAPNGTFVEKTVT